MAYHQCCRTLSGKYLRRKQRHKRLRDNEETIESLRFCFSSGLDHFEMLHREERQLTPAELENHLDLLWYELMQTALHLKRILG